MQTPEDKLLDKRLVYRHMRQGLITRDQVQAHLAGLPDVTDRAARIETEMSSVGVQSVEAKDTGENE